MTVDTMDLELSFLLPDPAALPAAIVAPDEPKTYTLKRRCPWVGLLDTGVGQAAYHAGLHLTLDEHIALAVCEAIMTPSSARLNALLEAI